MQHKKLKGSDQKKKDREGVTGSQPSHMGEVVQRRIMGRFKETNPDIFQWCPEERTH